MAKQEAETLSLPEGAVDWDKLWKTNSRRKGKGLPDELMSLNPERVSSVLYLSDLSPEGLSAAISETFPGANQVSKSLTQVFLSLFPEVKLHIARSLSFFHALSNG